jgi:hypothetical protein
MESTISCIRVMTKYLERHNLVVNPAGEFSRAIDPHKYNVGILKICSLILIGCIAYMISRYPYHHVTIMGNTIFSKISAAALSLNKIPFVLCKETHRVPYYTTDNMEIPFEGVSPQFFNNNLHQVTRIIPHSASEIEELEKHTHLQDLASVQKRLLDNFLYADGVYTTTMGKIIYNEGASKNPIINIKRFFGNLYYVMTTTEIWITKIIIGDNIFPLQPEDVVTCLYGNKVSMSNESIHITYNANVGTISEIDKSTKLVRRDGYEVKSDLSIKSLDESADDECVIYNLKRPRPFVHNGIKMIHPFHFPGTCDPFLSIMTITLATTMER